QVLLRSGQWRQALDLIQDLQQQGQATPVWQGRLRNLEGECHRAAGNQALKDQRYEEALEHLLLSTQLLSLTTEETPHQVIQTMLAEVRTRFATTTAADTEPIHQLIGRTVMIQSVCPEAFFWKALCHVRENALDLALVSLQTARSSSEAEDKEPR